MTFRDARRPAKYAPRASALAKLRTASVSPPTEAERPLTPWTQAGKPAFDFTVALLCLVIVSPLLVAVAVLVRLTTPGPAMFRQIRIGRDNRPFMLYKFRSMYAGSADEVHRQYVRKLLTQDQPPTGGQQGLYKLENDTRITPIGRFLRKMSIDELPQLLNVIRGDMSLVGPRPALPWEVEIIGEASAQRFLVRPGLTGLWQVSGRNALTMRQGLELDIEYVRRQSFAFDLTIMLKTVPVVLSARGVR
jgi:lipopolysaccharide/colanic/teichoic acid biosynthesis glycosyltransferase